MACCGGLHRQAPSWRSRRCSGSFRRCARAQPRGWPPSPLAAARAREPYRRACPGRARYRKNATSRPSAPGVALRPAGGQRVLCLAGTRGQTTCGRLPCRPWCRRPWISCWHLCRPEVRLGALQCIPHMSAGRHEHMHGPPHGACMVSAQCFALCPNVSGSTAHVACNGCARHCSIGNADDECHLTSACMRMCPHKT